MSKLPKLSKVLYKSFLLLILITPITNTYSWWGMGHMVIANIAYQHLNAKAKNKVDHLVAEFQKVTPSVNSFERLAVWPDNLYWKQKIFLTFNWHFIDMPYIADSRQYRMPVRKDNAVWAVNKIIASFQDNSLGKLL